MTTSIQKKICMLGAFSVGKTSLVQQYVRSIFSEKYLTTVGVKIDKKTIELDGKDVKLVIWDIQGEDQLQSLRMSYLRGMAGYLLVVDGSRKSTLEIADKLVSKLNSEMKPVPFICCLNKHDLTEDWELDEQQITDLKNKGWEFFLTSAKTGENVENVFRTLTEQILGFN